MPRDVLRRTSMRAWISIALVGTALIGFRPTAGAQSDDVSLGDVARSYRKTQAPPQQVIDNDNLPQVMDQGESKKWAISAPRPAPKTAAQLINFQSPNVMCALTFNGGGPDPLANAPRPERLPDEELSKIDGPATIVGDTLELSLLNATAWDVREVSVGLTIVHKQLSPSAAFLIGPAKLVPTKVENAGRKPADLTVVYRIHGTAAPFSTAVFRDIIGRQIAPDEEWHWAILQAKGFPPATSPVAEQSSGNADPVPPASVTSPVGDNSTGTLARGSATDSPKK